MDVTPPTMEELKGLVQAAKAMIAIFSTSEKEGSGVEKENRLKLSIVINRLRLSRLSGKEDRGQYYSTYSVTNPHMNCHRSLKTVIQKTHSCEKCARCSKTADRECNGEAIKFIRAESSVCNDIPVSLKVVVSSTVLRLSLLNLLQHCIQKKLRRLKMITLEDSSLDAV